jgi:Fibronectin type III-like domain
MRIKIIIIITLVRWGRYSSICFAAKGSQFITQLTDPVASMTRSVEDLRGCRKITLQPGERSRVTFRVTPADLKFYNSDLVYDWEPGDFVIRIGSDSSHTLSATVRWNKR